MIINYQSASDHEINFGPIKGFCLDIYISDDQRIKNIHGKVNFQAATKRRRV